MHAPNPCATKGHFWTPTPADAKSAMMLVGKTQCIRCRHIATAEDMALFGGSIKRDEPLGEVQRDYDPWKTA